MHMRDSVSKFCSRLHLPNYNTNFTHFEGSERAGSGGCAKCLNTPHRKAKHALHNRGVCAHYCPANKGQSPLPGSEVKYFSNLALTSRYSSASGGASFLEVILGQVSEYLRLSS